MSEPASKPDPWAASCHYCAAPVPMSAFGRPRMYCGARCKTRAWRDRKTILETLRAATFDTRDLDYEDAHRVA